MIQCLVTATSASQRLLEGDQKSADQILIDAVNIGNNHELDVKLVGDPEVADLIIFAESHHNDDAIRHVLENPVYRDFRSKCVIHCGMDYPMPIIPGLYPSINQHWARLLCCEGSPYLASLNPFIGNIDIAEVKVDKLASFMGACEGKSVRMRLLKIAARNKWDNILIHDSTKAFIGTLRSGNIDGHLNLKRQFAIDLLSSKFALCPGGRGPSSFRIFEAMKSGRAPVVIADDWTPPPGPNWDSFLIRIPESQIPEIPKILQSMSKDWELMGAAAREQWERHYSPANFGPKIISDAINILERTNKSSSRRAFYAFFYVNVPRRFDLLKGRLVRKCRSLVEKLRST